MKYFIGIPVPNSYKDKIEMVRAEARFLTTEPHITLVPPPALPDDDSFIEKVVEVCKNTKPFKVRLKNIGQFGDRVLYVGVNSPELIDLYEKMYDALNLEKENRGYTPHLTIVKQRPRRPVDLDAIRKKAEKRLSPYPVYTLNFIIVYHQPKEKFMYIPYMKIPFGN